MAKPCSVVDFISANAVCVPTILRHSVDRRHCARPMPATVTMYEDRLVGGSLTSFKTVQPCREVVPRRSGLRGRISFRRFQPFLFAGFTLQLQINNRLHTQCGRSVISRCLGSAPL